MPSTALVDSYTVHYIDIDRGVATGVYRYIYHQNQSTLKKFYVAVLLL